MHTRAKTTCRYQLANGRTDGLARRTWLADDSLVGCRNWERDDCGLRRLEPEHIFTRSGSPLTVIGLHMSIQVDPVGQGSQIVVSYGVAGSAVKVDVG